MKNRYIHHFLVLLAAASALTAGAFAQDVAPTVVQITTTPEGAVITCDGVVRSSAPLVLDGLQPGTHLLTASKQGYREARKTIHLDAGQRMAVDMQLDPITGLVLVHSTPSGADVGLDGAARGKTPLLLAGLPIGNYRLRFELDGYSPREVDLDVSDRIPQKVTISLTSDSATLRVSSSPSGARVVLNGITGGTTPCTLERIPEGDTTLAIELDGYRPFRRSIKLAAGDDQQVSATLDPLPGALQIVTIPEGARVYVDNQFRGEAPVALTDLPPGEYRVRAERPGYETLVRSVQLLQAESKTEEFRLASNCGRLELTTEPAGVKVLVDGKEQGTTAAKETRTDQISEPLAVDLLDPGSHNLQLSKAGYFTAEATLEIEKDQTLIRHVKLKQRFIPNYEVRTSDDVYRGVMVERNLQGDIRLEVRPGITRTISASDIRSHGPLRSEP